MLEWNHKSFPIHFDDLPLRQLITQQRVEILYELTFFFVFVKINSFTSRLKKIIDYTSLI